MFCFVYFQFTFDQLTSELSEKCQCVSVWFERFTGSLVTKQHWNCFVQRYRNILFSNSSSDAISGVFPLTWWIRIMFQLNLIIVPFINFYFKNEVGVGSLSLRYRTVYRQFSINISPWILLLLMFTWIDQNSTRCWMWGDTVFNFYNISVLTHRYLQHIV